MVRRLYLVAAALALLGPVWTSRGDVGAANPKLGGYYLALGDSFSVGSRNQYRTADHPCTSAIATNFVCMFFRYLRRLSPALQVLNLSENNVLTCSVATIRDCPVAAPHSPQLTTAVRFLTEHQGEVSPITLTLGSDEVANFIRRVANDPASISSDLTKTNTTFRQGFDVILSTLRAASPDAQIVVTTLPNPFTAVPSLVSPVVAHATQEFVVTLNAVIREEAPKYDVVVSDGALAFQESQQSPALLSYSSTGVASNSAAIKILPTERGDHVYAMQLIADSGYTLPLTLRIRVSKAIVRVHSHNEVSGSTSPGAVVTIKYVLPGNKHRTLRRTANDTGLFVERFTVGSRAGMARLQACVADLSGDTLCHSTLTFKVRR